MRSAMDGWAEDGWAEMDGLKTGWAQDWWVEDGLIAGRVDDE